MNRLTLFLLSFLAGWSVVVTAYADTAVPIFSFDASGTNGAAPEGQLAVGPDGNFYGTTQGGGSSNYGTVFRVTTDGNLTSLVQFTGTNGVNPIAGLTLGSDGNFYGTTEYGGTMFGNATINAGLGAGTVFRVSTNGLFARLASFDRTNGGTIYAGLTLGPDGHFYGVTSAGGIFGAGTVFKVTAAGNLTTLTNFSNAKGTSPVGGMVFGPDSYLYGATQSGGSSNLGAIFRVSTNGELITLYSFGATPTNGVNPKSTLVFGPDGNLYGTTTATGVGPYEVFPGFIIYIPIGNGTIYRVTTNGVLTTLVNLDDYNEGSNPNGNVVFDPDGNLYGTTYFGGRASGGTVYEVTSNAMLMTLVNFNGTNGAYPIAGVTFGPDKNIYGTAVGYGAGGNGTVFKLRNPPLYLGLAGSGSNSTVLVESYPNSTNRVWATTNLTAPSSWQDLGTVITDDDGNGQLLDTNTTDIPMKFYQLSYP